MRINTDIITLHGVERAKERVGIKGVRAAERQAKLAMTRGKTAEDLTSWERNYIRSVAKENCVAIAYNGFCYIASLTSGSCVTMFPLPSWWGKKKNYAGKQRIRKPKKFASMTTQRFDKYNYAQEYS